MRYGIVAVVLLGIGFLAGATIPGLFALEERHENIQPFPDCGDVAMTCLECPSCPTLSDLFSVDRDAQIDQIVKAMEAIASTAYPHDLDKLIEGWEQSYTARDIARIILDHAESNDIDPLVLTAIVWKESKFRVRTFGDYKNGKPRSCGMTQVMTTFRGRPECKELLDPYFAIGWTAEHLAKFPGWCKGWMCLRKYNGGDYEVKVWRIADRMRRATL